MRKSYLNLLLVFFLFWSGCQEDDNITSPHFSNELLDTWELKDSTQDNWKYLIFTSENYFYMLMGDEQNRHYIYDGVYSIIGNQLNMRGTLYIFNIHNNTLTLSNPGKTFTFIRDSSGTTKDEWVIPVSIIKEVPLVGQTNIQDITFDGSCFWVSTGMTGVVKIDSLGNSIVNYNVGSARGITFGNGNLWVSNYDTLKQINPLNGEITSRQEVQNDPFIYCLAYQSSGIWATTNDQLIKIFEGVPFYRVYFRANGIEVLNDQVWVTSDYYIYCIDLFSGKATRTYELPNYIGGLAFDGNNFWTITENSGLYSLLQLSIP